MERRAEVSWAGDVTWRDRARRLTRELAGVRRELKRRLGVLAPLRIVLYGGYGTRTDVTLRGRVLEQREGTAPRPEDGLLSNFKRSFWQFESDEVAGVELELEFLDTRGPGGEPERVRAVSDEDGYFVLRHRFATPVEAGWLPVQVRAVLTPYPVDELPTTRGEVLIPSPSARFGVISDIDDTILQSYVQNRARMIYWTLLGNPLTRLPFEGTTELYRGLRECGGGAPFFYVSRSMWNLFPLLQSFIAHQRLPRGPLLLRQVGLLAPRPAVPHKTGAIRELLSTYPELPFVLIGDSAEQDLSLYLDVARSFPGRVRAILIRNVSPVARRAALEQAAQQDVPPGCRVLVFSETRHAIDLCTELELWRPAPPQTLPPAAGAAGSVAAGEPSEPAPAGHGPGGDGPGEPSP